VNVGAAMRRDLQGVLLLAQDRNASRRRLLDEIVDRRLARSEIYQGRFTERRLTGSERIAFDNGSVINISAPTKDAAHGLTLDTVFLDEVWAHDSTIVLQAVNPTMVSRPDPQMWVVSTEGDEQSVLLDHFTNLGREAVDNPSSRVAYFEWSMPNGADPYDESRWHEWMPALGRTQSYDAVRSLAETMPAGDFLRAMCNHKAPIARDVFPPGAFDACCNPEAAAGGSVHIGVDTSTDRDRSSIAVVGRGQNGLPVVEIAYDEPGTDWLASRVLAMYGRHTVLSVSIDKLSPAAAIIAELLRAGIVVTEIATPEMRDACGTFYDAVMMCALEHRGQPELVEAVKCTRKRPLLDAWAWTRKGGYISPLVAATLAHAAWLRNGEAPLWIL
jgi:hypothetical protein